MRLAPRKHAGPIEALRIAMTGALDGSAAARDWAACLVRPVSARR